MVAFEKGNVDKILTYMSHAATWWVAGALEGISGTREKEALGEMLSGPSGLTKKRAISLTPLQWTCQGDRVAGERESCSELNNGRVYNNRYHFVCEARDGSSTQESRKSTRTPAP
jgi:ketosteroid isomerase-like protein